MPNEGTLTSDTASEAGRYFRHMAQFVGFAEEDSMAIKESQLVIEKHLPDLDARATKAWNLLLMVVLEMLSRSDSDEYDAEEGLLGGEVDQDKVHVQLPMVVMDSDVSQEASIE